MAESIIEQAAQQLRTDLAAIVSDSGITYWYTPDKVWLVTFFEDRFLDTSRDHIIMIRPGDELHEEQTSQRVRATQEFYILIAKRHTPSTELPETADTPTRWTVINRCVRDVMRALWADPQLNGLVENLAVEPVVVDRARLVEGWALAEIRLVAAYSYTKGAP